MKDIHESTNGQKTWLTATTNGRHAKNSDHYNGNAIDIVNDAFQDEEFRKAYIKKIEALGYRVYDEYDRSNWTENTTGEHLHVVLNGYQEPEVKKSRYDVDLSFGKPEEKKKESDDNSTTGKIVSDLLNPGKKEKQPGLAMPAASGFVSGSNEMTMAPFQGILDKFKRPQVNVPEINIPDISVPPVNVPDIKIPQMQIPNIPAPEIPQIALPDIKIPQMPNASYAQDTTRDNPQYLPHPEVANNSTSYAMNMGAPVININVAGTNATPKDIAGAVQDGIANLGDYLLNIQARNMRRPVV